MHELPREALLEKYNQEFLNLFRIAYSKSSFYNSLYKLHGISKSDIKDISDIQKLPVICKSDIKEKVDEVYHGNRYLKVNGYTSGTTGSPLTLYRSPMSVLREQAYILHFRIGNGFKPGSPLLSLMGKLGKGDLYRLDKASNILYVSSSNLNKNKINFIHKLVKDFGPQAVEAYPSSVCTFCQLMDEENLSLQIPLVFTSSESLYDFQKTGIEASLGCKVFDWYGNAERTISLAQDKNGLYFPPPLYSVNEFQEDCTITTGLINSTFPLIRYKVEDEISVEGNDLIKNIVAPGILRIKGRNHDSIQLKDGSRVHVPDMAFKGCENLSYAQIHQYSLDRPLEIKLVVNEKFNQENLSKLKKNLKKVLGEDTLLEFVFCSREDLTVTARSKFKLVIRHF